MPSDCPSQGSRVAFSLDPFCICRGCSELGHPGAHVTFPHRPQCHPSDSRTGVLNSRGHQRPVSAFPSVVPSPGLVELAPQRGGTRALSRGAPRACSSVVSLQLWTSVCNMQAPPPVSFGERWGPESEGPSWPPKSRPYSHFVSRPGFVLVVIVRSRVGLGSEASTGLKGTAHPGPEPCDLRPAPGFCSSCLEFHYYALSTEHAALICVETQPCFSLVGEGQGSQQLAPR